MPSLAYGLALALAVLFGSAAGHKLVAVNAGGAGNHPLVAGRGAFARRPVAVMLGAAAAEAGLAALLVLAPSAGLLLAAAVLATYALELRHIDPDAPCHCFAATTTATARTAIRRNLAVAALSLAAAPFAGGEIDWALALIGLVAVLAAIAVAEHLARPRARAERA